MRMSDIVTKYIMQLLEQSGGNAEIQRNELAGELGCVPSQINYVITSRFTPEQGYIVESRRGGGGYIRITRIKMDKSSTIMHTINSIGNHISSSVSVAMLNNLYQQDIMSKEARDLIGVAMSDRAYMGIPNDIRDTIRATLLKNMLLTLL